MKNFESKEGGPEDGDTQRFEIKQKAQSELIEMAGGESVALAWIEANSQKFNDIINNPKFGFFQKLANNLTRKAALEELKQKLYH